MDLFIPSRIPSFSKNKYILVDYCSFTWVIFPKHKDDVCHEFVIFFKRTQNKKSSSIITIKSDHREKI